MKHCSFFCAGWWPFIILPLLLLALTLFFKQRPIEELVAENTRASLADVGADWAQVETYNQGRDVLLSGTPPNEDAIKIAEDAALSAAGVRVVEVSTDQIVPSEPLQAVALNVLVDGDRVTLEGEVADQATIDQLVSHANSLYGASNVTNRLTIGDNIAALPSIDSLLTAVKDQAPALQLGLNDGQLTLRGEMPNQASKQSLLSTMSGLFAGQINDQLTVAAPTPPPPPPTVEKDVCEDLIAELLAQAKINFATGKATVSRDSYSLLEQIADVTKRCAQASFEVAGHTDSTGSADLNQRLSQARAQAVVDYLVQLGLPAEQFSARGYGPSQPVGDNTTAAGRAQNRRIEFRLKN